ncbi:Cytoplasmic dynein 2 heavy chain 1 [Frankliniella fusca]|uniref:Cytoplasmic dynein 2 heavy chain 1 n=1 Tax=Frankliniella fusca TaxID=407009 RepID=A0AAE1HZ40_9NEOP|nr:Cytoplasmic dynein 2 heavy chain 1 [Frankliniella fusca]
MAIDSRKIFILTTSGNYFNKPVSDSDIVSFGDNVILNKFLDDRHCLTLNVKFDGTKFTFTDAVLTGNGATLVFFKLRPDVVTPQNMHSNILVSSMLDSPVSALYHSLQKLYAPVLLKNFQSETVDPTLQQLLSQLEANLRSSLNKSSDSGEGKGDEPNVNVITTPEDELNYWATMAKSSGRGKDSAKASAFLNALQPLVHDLKSADTLTSLEESLETAHNALDDIWKLDEFRYPQKRMENLMEIIGNSITQFIQSKLKDIDLWEAPFNIVEESLGQSVAACERWIDTCKKLTSLFWPNHSLHAWKGNPFVPQHIQAFSKRLVEVQEIRTLHRQLTRLLSRQEQDELNTNKTFLPLQGLSPLFVRENINLLFVNPYTEPLWRSAVQQFQQSLHPTEERVASKLKVQLRSVNANTLQLLQEFKRYQELIQLDSVKRTLVPERENLLSLLLEYVHSTASSFTSGPKGTEVLDLPPVVSNIYWARQLEYKLSEIEKASFKILNDLSAFTDLQRSLTSLKKDVQEYRSKQWEVWLDDTRAAVSSKRLSLRTDEPVVHFEQGKLMHVNYNPELVGLIREVRHLSLLGYKIPVSITEASDLAKQFMRQAKSLQQVANFHNTIGDRMITSQRPMMLATALELARLVQEQSGVTWTNTAAVDAYINKLNTVVQKLARENNKLAAYHAQISSKVVSLLDTDLIRQQQSWKEILKEIRGILAQVEQEFSNLRSWRLHWDYQLYKALEFQYKSGLENLNQHLSEIQIELVYRQQILQYRPPLEEIRMKYYGQLKRYLNIPNVFKGVSETGENSIFPVMIKRNAHHFSGVFAKAEELFGRLEGLRERWIPWVALGATPLQQLVEEHLHSWQDWDNNFKASKNWGQQIAKLPSSDEKLECFSISLAPVRAEIDLQNRHYWDTLTSSLQASIFSEIAVVEKFINDSTEALSKQPRSVDEIGEAKAAYSEISNKTRQMMASLEEIQQKNKTLAGWTKERVEQVVRVTRSWDNFQTLLNNHQVFLDQQVEGIKNTIRSQVDSFEEEVENFGLRWEQLKPKETSLLDGGPQLLTQSLSFLQDKRQEWNEILKRKEKMEDECKLFNLPIPEFLVLQKIEEDLQYHENMWSLFDEFNSGIENMAKEEWIIFRSKSFRFEEFLNVWEARLKSSPEKTSLTVRLLQDVEKYKVEKLMRVEKVIVPLLKLVRGEMFSDKHWIEMLGILSIPAKPVESLVFKDFLSVKENILSQAGALQDLNNRASSEIVIRQALTELDIWEVEARFQLVSHRDSRGSSVMLIKDFQDILNKVGDNQSLLQSIKNSSNYGSFNDRVAVWEARLADIDYFLRNLNQIQRKWVYLEPIFGGGAVAVDGARFERLDRDFRYVMGCVANDSKVTALCRINNLHHILTTVLDQLNRCQKSLNEYLEEKRSSFPRFYFVGDEDLLEILGQSRKQHVIQAHLKKLFAGINSVVFDGTGDNDALCIIGMKSLDGEMVPLSNPVDITVSVEVWLQKLCSEMRKTLHLLTVECVRSNKNSNGGPDPLHFPSQVLCLSQSIIFTAQCEEAIRKGTLHSLLKSIKAQQDVYANVELAGFSEGNDDEGRILELKQKALLIDIVHHVHIVEDLIQCNTSSLEDWSWQRQLRFYMGKDNDVFMKMVDAQFTYTYEYLGNAPKLVQTPLTDKCFLTLTQGMQMGLGGNPYGPAGTGKTESVKALGSLLGRQVLVFNCDEGIDVVSMSRIFVGLVKCGAWGCFDEFNRLEEATLSAISMQIHPIQSAIKNRLPKVKILDQEVPLDLNAGIFVTLNPAGKGYGGRQKLPDNLKQLFRPVVMSTPDNELIAEVILYCEGFKNAKSIGKKLVEVFDLSRKLLTPQKHYDWGLRALKTVLGGCGSMLRNWWSTYDDSNVRSDVVLSKETEMELAVQALRLNTLSKLLFRDCVAFDALVQDVFPGINFISSGHEKLVAVLKETFSTLGLHYNKRQEQKCIELYEQLLQRMGVVVVGPAGSGKTTLCRLLKHALGQLGQLVRQHTVNPKAMPRSQLLGHIDLDTRQWVDGVLTTSAQRVYTEPPEIHSWIVCDGDVDPEWIESLNSVLDDNRLLTLPSGWRIQFGPNVNFIFETHDLSYASPATISRMGMILLSDEDIDIKGLVTMWLSHQSEGCQRILSQLIEDYFYRALQWVITQGEFTLPNSVVSLVKTCLSHFQRVENAAQFMVALIRGLGSNLTIPNRELFAKQIFDWFGEYPLDPVNILNCCYSSETGRIETYMFEGTPDIGVIGQSLPLVLTANVKLTLSILSVWLEQDSLEPFILVGPPGCGKSYILNECFRKLRGVEVSIVHCSAQITPQHVLQRLNQVCMVISSNTGRIYRPRNAERLVLYFKDINLAKPDKWGSSMLIAFLQQLITYHGFYDSDLEWVGLERVQIVGSMTGGMGRNSLSTRFTSIVHIHSIGLPENDELKSIYNLYMKAIFRQCVPAHPVWSATNKVAAFVNSLIHIYSEVCSTFTPMKQNHYLFTPRDLTQWCLGLLRYDLQSTDTSVVPVLKATVHEAFRIFSDKLVSDSDKVKFHDILLTTLDNDWNNAALLDQLNGTYFVTLGQGAAEASKTPYGKLFCQVDKNDLTAMVKNGMNIYSREGLALDLLILPELLQQVACVDRVLSAPRGSLLLAGRSGVGRKSSIRIASAIHSSKLLSPKVGRNYNLNNFKVDLKQAMQSAGVDGEQVILMLEDYQLGDVSSGFLDMVNSLLSSGEVPGLYQPEELESVVTPLRNLAAQDDFQGSLLTFFSERVLQNLHIVLVLDFTRSTFITLCESNPALYKQCSVMWWSDWSITSMQSIPQMLLQREENPTQIQNAIKSKDKILNLISQKLSQEESLLEGFSYIHQAAISQQRTPLRYILFVRTFLHIYITSTLDIYQRQEKLRAGVSKLTEAKQVVAKLKSDANYQEELLAEKQAAANNALEMITDTMRSANTQKTEMESLKEHTEKENQILITRKKEIEEELVEIEPLVNEARTAIGNIKTESLSEIRSLRAPPDVIRDILEGVLRLMGILDTSWNSMKIFLAKRGVKEDIRSFDAHSISEESRAAVEQLLRDRKESFDPKNAKRASVAAAPLAAWVTANVKYSRVLEKIRPLEQEQTKLLKNLQQAESQIGRLRSGLTDVDQAVAELKGQLNSYTQEAAQIQIHLSKARETIDSAEGLVLKLDEEYKRWKTMLTELSSNLGELPVSSLLAAASIVYLSSSPENVRKSYLEEWQDKFGLSSFHLAKFLASQRQQLQWQAEGLPSDQLSIQNAVTIMQIASLECGTMMRPLLVDPSYTATEWLQKHLASRMVEIVALHSDRFTTVLELAIRFGKILIVQEVDRIDPLLYPVLRGDFINQGPRKVVQLGEKLVDFNPEFQLFLTTRNVSPDIPPDIFSSITIVNFITSPAGLSGQLLACALCAERPELDKRRGELLRQEEELSAQLHTLQDGLLQQLAQAQGDILQNKELLASLNETKAKSAAISESLEESSRLQSELNKECDAYRPLADFGSSLYFATVDLEKLSSIYQLSITAFMRLFERALKTSEDLKSMEERHKSLRQRLLLFTFQYVSRSLFKADRLTFALHLTHKMCPSLFKTNEWEALTGQVLVDLKVDTSQLSDTVPKWLEEDKAFEVFLLQNALPEFYADLKLEDESAWNNFMLSENCEQILPSHVSGKITAFQRVLLVQTLRPDRLHSALMSFALSSLGVVDLSPPTLRLSQLLHELLSLEPILLITSAGADPSEELRTLAHSSVGEQRYHEIAMGQGQEGKVLENLSVAAKAGHWLCIKNLHLATFWLETLEKEFRSLLPQLHPEFRLWLITEMHPQFSPIVAQSCLKITYEAPPGVKRNLQRTYASWGPQLLNGSDRLFARSLFALAWFHAVIQERRTFIPQGWANYYEFSDGDLKAATLILQSLIKKKGSQSVQWEFIHGLLEKAIYGGRVDNTYDSCVLISYLQQFFNKAVLHEGSKLISDGIHVPNTSDFNDHCKTIQQLSEKDKPSYFGLPNNVDRSWQRVSSAVVVNQLKMLLRSKEGEQKFDKEEWQRLLSPILNLWKKLNQNLGLIHLRLDSKEIIEKDNMAKSPLEVFVMLEFHRAVELVQLVHQSLAAVSKVIRGTSLPNSVALATAGALISQETPSSWQAQWDGPGSPLHYVRGLVTRAAAIQRWRDKALQERFWSEALDLSDLLHPDTFLSALKQQTARELKTPLDQLALDCNWTEPIGRGRNVRVSGVQLEGAIWNGRELSSCNESSPPSMTIPTLYIAWVPQKVQSEMDEDFKMKLPLYRSGDRHTLIASLRVPCNHDQQTWIQAGAAFFLHN